MSPPPKTDTAIMTTETVQQPSSPQHPQFSNNWFQHSRPIWDQLIPQIDPTRILEIGTFEGASTCYLIDHLASRKGIEIHCVDTWQGGMEHKASHTDMSAVEARFLHNARLSIGRAAHRVTLHVHKGSSDLELAKLLADGKRGFFDFIYVDGSHQAPDVLCDAVLSFRLLRKGGYIAFDDYLWQEPQSKDNDPLRCPKVAIDAFTNIYSRQVRVIQARLYQLYLQKIGD